MKKLFLLPAFLILFSLTVAVTAQTEPTSPVKPVMGGVLNGKATSLPKPPYPPAAKAVRAGGTVNVQVLIDEQGKVVSASAVSGHPLLRAACEAAARGARFSPTTLSGTPVKVSGIITYTFEAPPSSEKASAAQDQTSAERKEGYEKQTAFMGLGVFLTFSDIIPDGEWSTPMESLSDDLPGFKNELSPITKITAATPREKRKEIIDGVIASLDSKLTGADAWQFEAGKTYAGLIMEFKALEESPDAQIDENSAKAKLRRLDELMPSAPADFPVEILDAIKETVKYKDVENLNANENKLALFKSTLNILKVISPR